MDQRPHLLRLSEHHSTHWPRVVVALLVVAAVGASLHCVMRRPTEPGPVKYNVYFGSTEYNNIYVVDLDSLLYSDNPPIIDSIPGFDEISDLAVSDDGRWLYVQSSLGMPPWNPSLKKYDLLTRDTAAILPNTQMSRLVPLAGGRLLRSRGSPGDVFGCMREIIDTDNMTIVRVLADTVCGFHGLRSGVKIAAAVGGTSRIRGLNIESGEYWGEFIARAPGGQTLHVVDAFLHPNDSLVAAIASTAGQIQVWFLIGNLYTGMVESAVRLELAYGGVGVSLDGRWVVATDPGDPYFGQSVANSIDVYDTESSTYLGRLAGHSDGVEGPPARVTFLPIANWLVLWPAYPVFHAGSITVVDVAGLSAHAVELPFSNRGLGGIGFGPRLSSAESH